MKLFAMLLLASTAAFGCAAAEKVILQGFGDPSRWELNSSCGSISKDGKTLSVDNEKFAGEWNWILKTAPGVLTPETNYVASFEYRVAEPNIKEKYFHFLCRPLDMNIPNRDTLRSNEGLAQTFQSVKLKFSTADDKLPAFQIHSFRKLKGEIRNFVLTETGKSTKEFIPITANPAPFTGELANRPTGAKEFEVELPKNSTGKVVNAAEFGVAESNPDNTPALNRALKHCREIGAAKLALPKGIYRMTSNESIQLVDMRDFEFDGGGSTFVCFREKNAAFFIKNCERIKLGNFNLDWDWERDPLASIVEVIQANEAFADFRFVDYQHFPRRDLRVALLSSYDPIAKAVGIEGGFDRGFEFYAGQGKPDTEWLNDNTLRIRSSGMNVFHPGQLFRMQHYYYDMNGFIMESNRHLTLEDINIYSTPGHALTSSGSQQYWQFRRVRIVAPKETTRVITCTADHYHISRSRGFFKMEDCEFSLGADDCLNAHDNTGYAEKSGKNTLRTRNAKGYLFQPGERIELRHGDYSFAADLGPIQERKTLDNAAGIHEITFAKPVPDPLKGEEGFVLFNQEYGTRNIIIRNNYFHSNRARGLLILAHDVTIENNRFIHNEMGAIKIETGYTFNVWSEGYGASNIVIRNNTFDTVNPRDVANEGMARDIYIGVYMKSDPSIERTTYPILSDILFENNTFRDTFGLIAFVSSARNVTFLGNTFENPTARKKPLSYRASFFVTASGDVKFLNNRYQASPHVPTPRVIFTPESVTDLKVQGNTIAQ